MLVRLTKQKRTWNINLPIYKAGYGTCRTAVLKALSSSGDAYTGDGETGEERREEEEDTRRQLIKMTALSHNYLP